MNIFTKLSTKFEAGLQLALDDVLPNILFTAFIIGAYIIVVTIASLFTPTILLLWYNVLTLAYHLMLTLLAVFSISTILYTFAVEVVEDADGEVE